MPTSRSETAGVPHDHEASSWLAAAEDGPVVAAYDAIVAVADEGARAVRPTCLASGRCCHFEAFGHRLYVTGLETAIVLARFRSTDQALSGRDTAGSIAASIAAGHCPFLERGGCGVHSIRPMPCRAFFCDRHAAVAIHSIHESAHAAIRHLHERFSQPYAYAEWRLMLDRLVAARCVATIGT